MVASWMTSQPPPPSPAARQPIICTSFCIAHHKLSTKGEIFSKYCNAMKTQGGGGPTNPPLLPLYHGGGVTLLVRPRVKLICFVWTWGISHPVSSKSLRILQLKGTFEILSYKIMQYFPIFWASFVLQIHFWWFQNWFKGRGLEYKSHWHKGQPSSSV